MSFETLGRQDDTHFNPMKPIINLDGQRPQKSARAKVNLGPKVVSYHLDLSVLRRDLLKLSDVLTNEQVKRTFVDGTETFLSSMESYRRHKGEVFAVDLWKQIYNYTKIRILGGRPQPIPFMKIVNSWPKPVGVLGKLIDLKTEEPLMINLVLTVLSGYKTQKSHAVEPDFTSVESIRPPLDEDIETRFKEFIDTSDMITFLRKEKFRSTSSIHCTGSNGIFGQSFYSIPFERMVLATEQHTDLRKSITRLNLLTARGFLNELLLDDRFNQKVPIADIETKYMRKLSVIKEPGNKNRIVCIADFFSQNALLPLHNFLMKALRNIPQDATYSSSEVVKALASRQLRGHDYFLCADLKDFTDNLPISLQEYILSKLVNIEYSQLWTRVMTEPAFNTYTKKTISYSRGQPMGILSSWAMATITHHALVRFAASRLPENKEGLDYYLLGDDIVICSKDLGFEYLRLLDSLHIPISKVKTFEGSGFEFCKRIFKNGKELTPFSWNILTSKNLNLKAVEFYRFARSMMDSVESKRLVNVFCLSSRSEVDKRLIEIYFELIEYQYAKPVRVIGSDSGTREKMFETFRTLLKAERIFMNLKELLSFNPSKVASPLKLATQDRRKKLRKFLDNSTLSIYHIILINYLDVYIRESSQWEQFIMGCASYSGDPVEPIFFNWSLLNSEEFQRYNFFQLDPSKRFTGDRKVEIIDWTLEQIKKNIYLFDIDIESEVEAANAKAFRDLLKLRFGYFFWSKGTGGYQGHQYDLRDPQEIGLRCYEILAKLSPELEYGRPW
jgi:hypothetical protein